MRAAEMKKPVKISLNFLLWLFIICFIGLFVVGGVAEAKKEKEEKEYWCKRATEYRKKIEKAQEDFEETEKKLAELEGNPLPNAKSKKALKQLNSKLRKSKKQLRNAERDLSYFEDEAHRKGIPPGWLRCQFGW
jgi:peptidoglycan hydrolase CwlO-like protein